jgi:thiopurine S-methyltransferase
MEPEFWHERWENGEIGFHRDAVNPHLKAFLGTAAWPPGANVLVPLCGKSLDLWFLRDRGFRVTGVEISRRAVLDFFAEAGQEPVRCVRDGREVFSVDRLELYCGDFFSITPSDLPEVQGVYDRAALVALPAPMRARYVSHLGRLLKPGIRTLLITLDYPQRQMGGPPFSVSPQEVEERYAADHEIRLLDSQDCLADEPRFRRKGLTRLDEHVFLLTRKPGLPEN